MPKLSVIIPALNAEASITRAVRSSLAALPADGEVVVLNDGSSDGTARALDELADPRLRVLSNPAPSGVCGGLTRLLEETDSLLVARMDADDVMAPWRLHHQVRALASGEGAVFTPVHEFGPARWQVSLRPTLPLSPDGFAAHLLLTNPVAHPAMAAHRSAIERAGGYREVPAEDYDLWLRMGLAGVSMRRLAIPGLLYRRHAGQVTANPEWRRQSWGNRTVAETYADFAQHVTGLRLQRLVFLAVSDETEDVVAAELERTRGAVSALADRLPQMQQRAVRQMLARRLAWVQSYRATSRGPSH